MVVCGLFERKRTRRGGGLVRGGEEGLAGMGMAVMRASQRGSVRGSRCVDAGVVEWGETTPERRMLILAVMMTLMRFRV